MENECGQAQRVVSLPNLIGWLSVCMLAGAFGHTLDPYWQTIWAEAGAFGLAAAVGLGSIERFRQSRRQNSRDKVLKARVECGLAKLSQHSATIDSINAAVRKLAEQALTESRGKLGKAQRNRRRDQMQMLSDYPLEIAPIMEESDGGLMLEPMSGVLQQISSRVVSFEHSDTIPTRTVLLTFCSGKQRLSFVVDVTWTQKLDGVFTSGGTVLAVGVPDDAPNDAPAAEALAV